MRGNIKLSLKIWGGFGLVLAALLVVGLVGLLDIRGVSAVVSDLSDTHMPLTESVSSLKAGMISQQLAATNFALHGDQAFREAFNALDQKLGQQMSTAKAQVAADQDLVAKGWLERLKAIHAGHLEFVNAGKALVEAVASSAPKDRRDALADQMASRATASLGLMEEMLRINAAESRDVAGQAARSARSAIFTIVLVGGATLLAGLLLAWLVTRSIVKPVRRSIASLEASSSQVGAASAQVSSASQSLAEGASEQAASLEQTAASLEQLSATVMRNADNAQQADDLMGQAGETVKAANQALTELTGSMDEITAASEETAKINKTIDEIAFQTNLLALNAAVEAARAGESGAGFAVVADEVRRLALRAAEAARNTSGLIDNTLNKVGSGARLVKKTGDAFGEVSRSAAKVAELISEIAAASAEQHQGIGQLNQVMHQIEKVTQTNAASAEQSAAASEELNAQAASLLDEMGHLTVLVEGGGGNGDGRALARLPRSAPAAGRRRLPPASSRALIPLDGEAEDFDVF